MSDPILDVSYELLYSLALLTVAAILASTYAHGRRMKVRFTVSRVFSLFRSELVKLREGDSVVIMHASIAAGVGLSILFTLANPFLFTSKTLRSALLLLSLPIQAGLMAAFVWRLVRLSRSAGVQKELGVSSDFVRNSFWLQTLLIFAIGLTIAQLLLEWVPGLQLATTSLDSVRNLLVAADYVRPALNLIANFDRPLSETTTPFLLKDVLEGRLDPADVRVGASVLGDFTEHEKNSFEACVEIGACEAACPATAVSRPLSPRVLVRKLALLDRDSAGSGLFPTIGEEELWACTTCAACVESCPVGVRHLDMIVDMRRSLTSSSKLDKKKSELLLSLSQTRNSMGTANQGRNSWLRELGVKSVDENPSFEYLIWIGCISSFDEDSRTSVRSFVSILRDAGLLDKFAILGERETCCGDPARRLGEESLFQEMALANIDLFRRYGVRKMVLTCPHGCNVFTNDYVKLDQWMDSVTVLHQVQILEELLKEGKIVKSSDSDLKIAIHDPCYLSRYMGIVNSQRELLSSFGRVSEPRLHGRHTFCCGAGGANYWYQVPEKKRISHERVEQLSACGPDAIVTLCPFCNAMLKDAAGSLGLERSKVKDIAELVREKVLREPKPEEKR
jgi:Fe-S oxidoreductase